MTTSKDNLAEAVEQEVNAVLRFADLLAGDNTVPFTMPGRVETTALSDTVSLVRRRWPLSGSISLRADALPGPYGASRPSVTTSSSPPSTGNPWWWPG